MVSEKDVRNETSSIDVKTHLTLHIQPTTTVREKKCFPWKQVERQTVNNSKKNIL